MTGTKSLLSAVAVTLALSSIISASPTLFNRDTASAAKSAPCTNFGPADEFYYKLSAHSDPLFGVDISSSTGRLIAVRTKDTNVTFQFERCDAPSTGYIQGQPITEGYAPEYFGHVRHVPTGKCLKHRDETLDFVLDTCPTVDTAEAQLPFWFESPTATNGVVRYTGYKNTTAYPQPEWFAGEPADKTRFAIKTNKEGAKGEPNQWVLARPIRV